MDAIDKAFQQTDSNSTASNGEKPRWMIRLFISILLAVVLLLVVKPQGILDIKYDAKTNACKITTNTTQFLYYSLPTTIVCYFLVMKYY
jgi:hypothetical protein